jgi:hypothetical protein
VVKLELLSDNLMILIEELLNNQSIAKYLKYNDKDAINKPDILLPANSLLMNKIFPFPFNPNISTDDCSQIRVYYPDGGFDDSQVWLDTDIFFDIVVAKKLWLTSDGQRSSIRPYEIMRHTIEQFKDRSIGTLGKLIFTRFIHMNANDNFDVIRLGAQMSTIVNKNNKG